MKTEPMNTDEALNLMQKCLPYIDGLVLDERAIKMAGNAVKRKALAMEMMLGDSREKLYGLFSIVLDIDIKELKEQEFTKTYDQIAKCMNGEFFSFFTLLSAMAVKL